MSQNESRQEKTQENQAPPVSGSIGSSHEEANYARLNPLLLRVHADDQNKKTLCIFWVVLFFLVFLIAIVASFAMPQLYIKQDRNTYKTSNSFCNFPQTPIISGKMISCGNYYTSSSIGQIIFGWGPINQFGLQYLQIIPTDLNEAFTLTFVVNISLYQIRPKFNTQTEKTQFEVYQLEDSAKETIEFSSNKAQKLYASDGETQIGYQQRIAVLTRLQDQHFFMNLKFDQNFPISQVAAVYSQSYAINSQFTIYTFALRYAFFALSIVGMTLYIFRYVKVPVEKRIIEMKFVAVLSILLIMFNDPFYPITVLKPNGFSAFLSTVFIVNLIVALILFWMVTADRILQEDGSLTTEAFTKKKLAYAIFFWVLLVVCIMIYTIHQITESPILTNDFQKNFRIATVIVIIALVIPILYIAVRYAQICAFSQSKLWRSYIFIVFSSIFVLIVTILVASNAIAPFNYSGAAVFLTYSIINIYVYYMQYMFSITREENEKMEGIIRNGGIQANVDVLTVGSIDVVDVDLQYKIHYQERDSEQKDRNSDQKGLKGSAGGHKYQLVEKEQDSEAPVAKNKSEFQSFDFQ